MSLFQAAIDSPKGEYMSTQNEGRDATTRVVHRRVADILYSLLLVSGIIAAALLLQHGYNYSQSTILLQNTFGLVAAATGIAGLRRASISKPYLRLVQASSIICYLIIAWWITIYLLSASEPA